MCMCDEAYGRVKPFQFLKEIMESFNLMFSGEEEQLEGTVARSYSNIILQKMKSYSDPLPSPAIPEKARQVRKELDEVHGVLKNNIEKVISRGEAIDSLVHRSDSLHFSASNFKSSSRKLKQSLCWQEWKLKILIAAIMSVSNTHRQYADVFIDFFFPLIFSFVCVDFSRLSFI